MVGAKLLGGGKKEDAERNQQHPSNEDPQCAELIFAHVPQETVQMFTECGECVLYSEVHISHWPPKGNSRGLMWLMRIKLTDLPL